MNKIILFAFIGAEKHICARLFIAGMNFSNMQPKGSSSSFLEGSWPIGLNDNHHISNRDVYTLQSM
ncbi:MAG: hypothetical protein VB024_10425 [Dysgonamonadaceae bacterium]|nr:hypothetical protein [Dysgonamonadaceae bacterium]